MIEIGPNLTSVLLAVVAVLASLCSGGVALWTLRAHGLNAVQTANNTTRIDTVEKVLNGAMKEKV